MRKVIGLAAVLGLALAACDMDLMTYGFGATAKAKDRVEAMLKGWQDGGAGEAFDTQLAACKWYNGTAVIGDLTVLGRANDGFEEWRGAIGYGYRSISTYQVLDAEVVPDTSPAVIRVKIKIDGHDHVVEVIEREPIRWAKTPLG